MSPNVYVMAEKEKMSQHFCSANRVNRKEVHTDSVAFCDLIRLNCNDIHHKCNRST